MKNKIKKENISLINDKGAYFIIFNDFKFFLSFPENTLLIVDISYIGNDNFLKYAFNNELNNDLSKEEKEKILINYILTNSLYFFNLSEKLKLSFIPEINNIFNNFLNSKNFYQFYFNLSLICELHIHSLSFDELPKKINEKKDKIKYFNFINEVLKTYEKENKYLLKDNFMKLKLYYFYKTNNYELFNFFFERIINNYPETSNIDFIKLIELDLYKIKNLKIEMRRLINLISSTNIKELKKELYFELFYHLLFFNNSSDDWNFSEKIFKNIEIDFLDDDLFKYINLQIKQKKYRDDEIIKSYKDFHLNLIFKKEESKIRELITAIISNQIKDDKYIYSPYPDFNILKTVNGFIVINANNKLQIKNGDLIFSLNNFRINDYFDFLIALNNSEVNKNIPIKYFENLKLLESEIVLINYNK
ncbi:MAG TPA: hypothetical protein PK189_11510 [bacterium]|nr:hypothetical protein [bacterium]